jgi:hypothetical protein
VIADLERFEQIWCVDFEFISKPGEHPDVLCLCALELRSGQSFKMWENQFGAAPPYRIDDGAAFVCFSAMAECTCHLALGWTLPKNVIDLSPMFRCHINGRVPPAAGKGLVGALSHFGLDSVGEKYKEAMRTRILAGRPYSQEERGRILTYCFSDVINLGPLLEKLLAHVNLDIGLHWGEFAAVSAQMEHNGVPLDMEIVPQLQDKHVWDFIRDALIPKINEQYGVYVLNKDGGWHWNDNLFEACCARFGIDWPRHENGKLDLRAKTFDSMAKAYPQMELLRQLRHTRNKMRRIRLAVGSDGRNRTTLWTHVSKTGRSQPKASRWIFSPAVWLRILIKPEPGRAIAYIDWSGMEFQVAAALSDCKPMLDLYATGSPYIEFAKRFGEAPPEAIKKTHGHIHERYKVGLLGIQYQMQHLTLAQRLGVSALAACEMLNQHNGLFRQYWCWTEDWIARALDTGVMWTPLGWECRTGITEFNARSIGNWPTQAAGADILRIAVVWAHRHGIKLLGSVHDAILIEAPIDRIEADVALMQEIMRRASRIVLGTGKELRTSADIYCYPKSYFDQRGEKIWNEVMALLEQYHGQQESDDAAANA